MAAEKMKDTSGETKQEPEALPGAPGAGAQRRMDPEIVAKIVAPAGSPPAKPLEERYFVLREIKQNEWFATVYANVTVDDLLKREFWSGVAHKLQRGGKIVVMSEDSRLYVELVVFAVGARWVEVKVFGEPIIVTSAVANMSSGTDYVVKDLGLIKKWGVVEIGTGREVHTGELTEETARGWLRDHLQTENRSRA